MEQIDTVAVIRRPVPVQRRDESWGYIHPFTATWYGGFPTRAAARAARNAVKGAVPVNDAGVPEQVTTEQVTTEEAPEPNVPPQEPIVTPVPPVATGAGWYLTEATHTLKVGSRTLAMWHHLGCYPGQTAQQLIEALGKGADQIVQDLRRKGLVEKR